MSNFDWKPFLERWSQAILASDDARFFKLPQSVIESDWLGYPGATETQIANVEQTIGKMLPPSYRQFLQITNGWRHTGNFIYKIWSVEKINWLKVLNQDIIDIWVDDSVENSSDEMPYVNHGDYRISEVRNFADLRSVLQISDWGDAALYLLNPSIITSDDEWEAWFFASWIPGAYRFPSFWEMLQYEYHTLLEHQAQQNKRAKTDNEIIDKLPHLLEELRTKASMYPRDTGEPAGTAYGDGIRAAFTEAQQRIHQLQQTYQTPGELRVHLLQLADEFDERTRKFPRGIGSVFGMMLDEMMDKIGEGGKIEGYRQAAGIIRWFLGEI